MTSNIRLVADTSELERDLDRIEAGELQLPTVSAIDLLVDDECIEECVVYLYAEGTIE